MDSIPKTLKCWYQHPFADLVEIMALLCFQEQESRQLLKFQSFMASLWYNVTLTLLKKKIFKLWLKWTKMESYLMKKLSMISKLLRKLKILKGKRISFIKSKRRYTQEEQFKKKLKSNKLISQAILKTKIKCKIIQIKKKKKENKTNIRTLKDKKE